MKILLAKGAGFCFGVRRATGTLEDCIERHGRTDGIYTYGEIIHNSGYLEQIKSKGVAVVGMDDIEGIASSEVSREGHESYVIIRAHGITKEEEEALSRLESENKHFHVIDCTCPFVSKVHRIAEEHTDDGSVFILIGAAEHPEVKGILSWAKGQRLTFSTARELSEFISSEKGREIEDKQIIAAAQTTQNIDEWKKCAENLKKVYTNAKIFDTICNVTDERQREAAKTAPMCNAMLVIGGAHSSNTMKLYDICSKGCRTVYRIDSSKDIPTEILGKNNIIGITAGASTPDGIIEEVVKTMAESEIMEESFKELLDQESPKTIKSGDIVTGTVTSVSDAEVHLDIGAKATGVIAFDQFTDDSSAKLTEIAKVGDEVRAFVIKVSDIDGIATLSKRRADADAKWFDLEALKESGSLAEGKVIEANKGGVVMMVNSVRVFVPAFLTGVPKDGDLNSIVGETKKVKLREVNPRSKRATGSIRDAARIERRANEDAFWKSVEPGKVYTGKVKHLTEYGAFVEIAPGIEGMVHMSELTWRHIRRPADVISVGDEIEVHVLSAVRETKRISLSCKTPENNPWNIFKEKYSIGDVVKVKILNFTTFGAFAEVVPGQDGLIHISEISDHRISKPSDELSVGDLVDAKIIGIDDDNRKISLSIRELIEDGYVSEDEPEEEYEESDESEVVYSTDDVHEDEEVTEEDVPAEAEESSADEEAPAETETPEE